MPTEFSESKQWRKKNKNKIKNQLLQFLTWTLLLSVSSASSRKLGSISAGSRSFLEQRLVIETSEVLP